MRNFTFYNPVKIFFGKDQINYLRTEIPADTKIMFLYDDSFIYKTEFYDKIISMLDKHCIIEFGYIRSNPTVEMLLPAIELARREQVGFLLAMGGGSVIDATKFVAAALLFEGDPWDLLTKQANVKAAVPLGAILTLPAAGSEMNQYAVISNEAQKLKLEFKSPLIFPKFAILDPEVTFSLPRYCLACGIVDAFVHVIEQYVTDFINAPLQDAMAETILLTLIANAQKSLNHSTDYDSRANIMWAATLATNELLSLGVAEDWLTHKIGLELTALYGIDHACSVAIILPAALNKMRKQKEKKLLLYAERIWGISQGSIDTKIEKAIVKTIGFFESLGIKTHLSDYNLPFDCLTKIASRADKHDITELSKHPKITSLLVKEILQLAW